MARKPPASKPLFPDLPTEPADAAAPQDMFPLPRKETTMLYKTICLQMIQDRPEMYDRLLKHRTLLPTLERFARQLRSSHQAWKERLLRAKPGGSESQIASEALELASGNWVCLPRRLRRRRTSGSPWRTQWRFSAVIRRLRKGVARSAPALAVRPRPRPREAADAGGRNSAFAFRSPSPSGPARGLGRRHGNQPAGPCKRKPGSP